MLIIGCDFHPQLEQVAWFNPETGKRERELGNGTAKPSDGTGQLPVPSLIGRQATHVSGSRVAGDGHEAAGVGDECGDRVSQRAQAEQ